MTPLRSRREHPSAIILGRGGVRGIAMVGAVGALERAGLRFDRYAGISVGGIVAALMAAGCSAAELRAQLWQLDLPSLCDAGCARRLPLIGHAYRLLRYGGLYDGEVLLETLRDLLARRGVRTFRDLRDPAWDGRGSPWRLQVLVSDLTNARLVVLPDDAAAYGVDPDSLEVALALRMSASLPFVFRPLRFGAAGRASVFVDGGLVAGIPFPLFDAAGRGAPVIGVQAGPGPARYAGRPVTGAWSIARATFYTALRANDEGARPRALANDVIDIDCGSVSAVAFSLSDPQKQALYDAGFAAASGWLLRPRLELVQQHAGGVTALP